MPIKFCSEANFFRLEVIYIYSMSTLVFSIIKARIHNVIEKSYMRPYSTRICNKCDVNYLWKRLKNLKNYISMSTLVFYIIKTRIQNFIEKSYMLPYSKIGRASCRERV